MLNHPKKIIILIILNIMSAIVVSKDFSVEQAFNLEPQSVVRTGKDIISGTDRNDYVSFAPYWWRCPDPNPNDFYYRIDGKRNNDLVKTGDAQKFQNLSQAVVVLARAYDKKDPTTKKYITKAADLIKTWFINAQTKMNPNLNYGQMINGPHNGNKYSDSCTPNQNDIQLKGGSKSGIIEFRYMISLLAVMPIIVEAGGLSSQEQDKFKDWLGQYYIWLTTSLQGRQEALTKNNHAAWYDAQAISIAMYLNKTDEVKLRLNRVKDKIATQISPDGKLINELFRAQGLTYSLFNLQAFYTLAALGQQAGVDLWNYKAPEGQGLNKAYDFIKQFKGQCQTDGPCKFGKNNEYSQSDAVKSRSWEVLEPANRQFIIYNITS